MTSVSASAVVEAPPEKVWAMVADVTRMGEWSPETQSCEWVDGATGPDVGARFKGHNKRGPVARWTTTCTVVESEPGRVFAFAVGDAEKPDNVWRYSFVPSGEGATMVTETCEFPKPMSLAFKAITFATLGVRDREGDLKRGIEQTLARLQVAGRAATL